MVLPWYAEYVQAAAEDSAAGQSGAEPETEDGQRAVRAVCEGDDAWPACLRLPTGRYFSVL